MRKQDNTATIPLTGESTGWEIILRRPPVALSSRRQLKKQQKRDVPRRRERGNFKISLWKNGKTCIRSSGGYPRWKKRRRWLRMMSRQERSRK